MAVASLTLGILSIAMFWTSWIAILVGAVGAIFGGIVLTKHDEQHGLARAGLITGIVGMIGGSVFLAFVLMLANSLSTI